MNIPRFLATMLSVPAFTGAGKVKYLCISTGRELLRQFSPLNIASRYEAFLSFKQSMLGSIMDHYSGMEKYKKARVKMQKKKTRKQQCCLGRITGPSLSLGLFVTRKPDTGQVLTKGMVHPICSSLLVEHLFLQGDKPAKISKPK